MGDALPIEIYDNITAISGGHLGEHCELKYWQRLWFAKFCDRDGMRFVTIDKLNHTCCKFFNHNFEMVDRITTLRNQKVVQLIKEKADAGE